MNRIKLRPYQEQALAAEDAYRAEHPDENRLLIEMATGLGKSITLGERARRWIERDLTNSPDHGSGRVLILVHTDELVRQLAADAAMMAPDWSVGIVKATQNEVNADIIVASVQTLAQPGRKEQITDVGYIIVDEAHHATARTYVEVLEHFGAMPSCTCPTTYATYEGPERDCPEHGEVPPVPVLGMTATPTRSDGTGLGTVWHNLVFSRNLTWGIRHGYLCDIVPYAVRVPDLSAVPDVPSTMDAQLADGIAPEAVVQAWMEKTLRVDQINLDGSMYHPRPSTVLFAPLVRSAEAFQDAFQCAGVTAAVVSGNMHPDLIKERLDAFRRGEVTVLCNAMMMTEGVNIPRIKCVIWSRPLKQSASPLLIQGVGRGTRFWLEAAAPPREEQKCILLMVTPEAAPGLATVADLSDNLGESADGKSVLQMADEWDIGKALDAQEAERLYRGPVAVERWDAAVQASSKAWKYTAGGVPFLPIAKRGQGYVFVVERPAGWEISGETEWTVWSRRPALEGSRNARHASARDLELALALAEDVALEHGGDLGRLLADRNRAWRKAVPSQDLVDLAAKIGVSQQDFDRIMTSKAAGKAGKLSDLVDKVMASRVLDPVARKIKERA